MFNAILMNAFESLFKAVDFKTIFRKPIQKNPYLQQKILGNIIKKLRYRSIAVAGILFQCQLMVPCMCAWTSRHTCWALAPSVWLWAGADAGLGVCGRSMNTCW